MGEAAECQRVAGGGWLGSGWLARAKEMKSYWFSRAAATAAAGASLLLVWSELTLLASQQLSPFGQSHTQHTRSVTHAR